SYVSAYRARESLIHATINHDAGRDTLIGPTNDQPPFDIGTMVPEQAISNMFTLGKPPLANILGFPAISVACGFTPEKLPVGMQLIGKPFEDKKVLEIADCYERSEEWVALLEKNTQYLTSESI